VENKLVSHRESLQHLSTLGWYVLASPKSAGEKTRKRPVSEGKIRAQNRNQGIRLGPELKGLSLL
jgi:hypothetical protein